MNRMPGDIPLTQIPHEIAGHDLPEAVYQETFRRSPIGFAHVILGVDLWAKQEEVLNALRDHRRVAVKAGNGVGKGFTAAVAVLWFLCSHQPATVLTTAPTARQVRHILWQEIRRLYRASAYPLGGKLLVTRFELETDRFALGLSTDEVDQFQGFHSPNMLIVVDEAEGVIEPIYEAIDAVMTAGNSKLLLIGNPTSVTGTFRRAFHEERHLYHNITISALDSPNVKQQRVVLPGLTTHEWVAERVALWGEASPMYHARVLGDFSDRAEDTLISLTHIEQAIARHATLVVAPPSVIPRLPSVIPAKAGTHACPGPRSGGPDSVATEDSDDNSHFPLRGKVRMGVEEEDEPPAPALLSVRPERSETVNPSGLPRSHPSHQSRHPHPSPSLPVRPERSETVSLPDLPRSEVSPSHEVEGPTPDDEDTNAPTILAVDVARFGADQSVLLLASPTAVLRLEAHHGLDTMQLAGRVVDAHRHWSPARPPDRIVVDEIGVGAGVVDRLKELGLPVTGINVGRPARQRTLFANLRAEGYWRLRELFSQSQVAIPNDPELAGQLSSLRYSYNSRGQLIIESKDDARARGIPSPDKADAMMLAFLGHNPSVRLRT